MSIVEVEREIDEAFADNPLARVPWSQSAWTLLSVAEDLHFMNAVIKPLSDRQSAVFVDGLINELTHPLRVLRKRAPLAPAKLERRYIEAHYGYAWEWLRAAHDYNQFCSVFPMYHSGEIELEVSGGFLEPSNWSTKDLSYEAYDRFVAKRDPASEKKLDASAVLATLKTCIRSSGGMYTVDFSRRLFADLYRHWGAAVEGRHVLPDDWQFTRFSLAQYRAVFVCLHLAAEACFVARQVVAPGVTGMAYQSSVWTIRKGMLRKLLTRQSEVPLEIVEAVLEYLTFGGVGIRNPDIAIQPIVDLGEDHFAVSPFLLTQVHAERNLCVLLNQVPADRRLYLALVAEKEHRLRNETIQSLASLDLDFRFGKVGGTDVDLAIVDRRARVCLCIELKWFIEPAEIREVLMRSEELQKGVAQGKTLTALFAASDARLFELLGVEADFDFQAMVGSVNFIGRQGIQDPAIPITKLWHLVARIKETGSLNAAVQWLRTREYLPVKERDFRVVEMPIESGKWKSRWYGLAYP